MKFTNITNTYQQPTKDLKKAEIDHSTKRSILNPLEQIYYKFDWLCLSDKEIKVLSEVGSIQQYDTLRIQLWNEKSIYHTEYPLKLQFQNYPESLKNHSIDEIKRHQLIVWMGQALSCFQNNSFDTYFLSIIILDKFLKLYDKKLNNTHLQSLGVSCMGLASKMRDIQCLNSENLVQLTFDKIPIEYIQQMQIVITQTLNHNLELDTPFGAFDYLMRDLEFKLNDLTQCSKINIIYWKALELLKFVYHFYDTTIHQFNTVAFGCIYYTFKRLQSMKYCFPTNLNQILLQIQTEQEIKYTELILKLIYNLCCQGLSHYQEKYFQTIQFIY